MSRSTEFAFAVGSDFRYVVADCVHVFGTFERDMHNDLGVRDLPALPLAD